MSYYDVPSLSAGYPFVAPLHGGPRKSFRPFHTAFHVLATWQARIAEREALRQMPAARLHDIGADIAWAQREADKPFWRA